MDLLLQAEHWKQEWLPAPLDEILGMWTMMRWSLDRAADYQTVVYTYMCPHDRERLEIFVRQPRGHAPVLEKVAISIRNPRWYSNFLLHSECGPAKVQWNYVRGDPPVFMWYAFCGDLMNTREKWTRRKNDFVAASR